MNTVTHTDIAKALGSVDVFRVMFADTTYSLTSREWLKTFAGRFKHWRANQLDGEDYEPQENDCDDYAEDARYYARKSHRRTQRAAKSATRAGLAFGIASYVTDAGGGHMINVTVCRDDGKLVPVFWEPQTGKEVQLSDEEKGWVQVWI